MNDWRDKEIPLDTLIECYEREIILSGNFIPFKDYLNLFFDRKSHDEVTLKRIECESQVASLWDLGLQY